MNIKPMQTVERVFTLKLLFVFICAFLISAHAGWSQSAENWIQIEAQPNFASAEEQAKTYAVGIEKVSAYSIGAGWYVIAIGPFSETEAEQKLLSLRQAGSVPPDSFISRGLNYNEKVWPAQIVTAQTDDPNGTTSTPQNTQAQTLTLPREPDETRDQARASEKLLSLAAKKELQEALKWAGYYNSVIDGVYGRGTRSAMANWQADQDVAATGILTTKQREYLLNKYNAPILRFGLELFEDTQSGVRMKIPAALVGFKEYVPPLAHFAPFAGGEEAVYFISQEGGQKQLATMFKALQTLGIFPDKAKKSLKKNRFEITAEADRYVTYAFAEAQDGQIKGFIVKWPTGDAAARKRLFDTMTASFETFGGTLDPSLGTQEIETETLLFGLEIKRPEFSRSGTFVSDKGHIVTDASRLETCSKIDVEGFYRAELAATDASGSLALLRILDEVEPDRVAELSTASLQKGEAVIAAGYSYNGKLMAPSVFGGNIADLASLEGNSAQFRTDLSVKDGDIGGPVLTQKGTLAGILVGAEDANRQLPDNVAHATKSEAVVDLLNQAGLFVSYTKGETNLSDITLAKRARAMTGLVRCWRD